jgi:hypothetical protein
MPYFIEDTFLNIYTACGLESTLKEIPQEDNHEIEKDFYSRTETFRIPQVQELLEQHYLPEIDDKEHPIRNRYLQGDLDGGNLKFLGGYIPFKDDNDPEDSNEQAFANNIDARAAYIDSDGRPTGFTILYRTDKPEQWIIIIAQDTHLPKDKRKVFILSSENPEHFTQRKDILQVSKFDVDKIPDSIAKLKEAANHPAISAALDCILNKDGTIKKQAGLFHSLFTGMLHKGKSFDDDESWIKILKEHASDIINNPLLITLTSLKIQLRKEQINDCLEKDSLLATTLQSIIDDESLKKDLELQTQKLHLAISLDKLGHLDQFAEFAKDEQYFLEFFNQIVDDSQNDALLKLILKDKKLDCLRFIQKSAHSKELITMLQTSEHSAELMEKLIALDQLTKIEANKPKNEHVLPLAIQYLIEHPDTDLGNVNFKKLMDFFNETPGIEKIKPTLLLPFLFKNMDDEALLQSVKETLAKLLALKIANVASYELALNNEEGKGNLFREIASALKIEELESSQQCIEFATNLNKLDKLATYAELSTQIKWINSFNNFIKYECLKDTLNEKLSDVEQCKPILENTLLNQLTAQSIVIKKEQVEKILNAEHELSKTLYIIFNDEELSDDRKTALYQLAIDLDTLDALPSFRHFENDENRFLNVFHELIVVPHSSELLQQLLAEFAPGLRLLRVIADSTNPVDHFKNYLTKHTVDVNKALNWLEDSKQKPNIKRLAIELLLKKPEISYDKFISSVAFLRTTPKSDLGGLMISTFLSEHYEDTELLAEVSTTFKKLAALGIENNTAYKKALEQDNFRSIVFHLPPISPDKASNCSLRSLDHIPSVEEYQQFASSSYIITTNELVYFNKANNKLSTIALEKSQLEQLNNTFTKLPIDKLTKEQFQQLSTLAPVVKHNKAQLSLANKLSLMGHLDKYPLLAYENHLVSSFNKFINEKFLEDMLKQRLSLEEAFLEKTKELLENKHVNDLVDANICPTIPQINQLLDPDSIKSKTMEHLSSLQIKEKTAYQWAFIDTPTAEQFRTNLDSIITDQEIKEDLIKSKIIKTLCLLQADDKEKRNCFKLYAENKKFRKAILKIEETCLKISTRLNEEAPEKAATFSTAETEYRKGLYQVIYDTLNSKEKQTKEEFEKKIEEKSKPMFDVVDKDRHPWLRIALAVLVNSLNIMFFLTLPVRCFTGKSLFYTHTKSGEEVRDLHTELETDFRPN